ncbi:Nucleolysin TIA-1 [Choanephora cucurbitarum]|uniref:Nucleolysin TIA-1 n=1 Tax=Choanephora cucurbitarum TaxID=101091 RepID=A0A1C7MYJ6_9FUNG|nr:Nucleolysin TIA-1 [Choanephora cucurbitarum]
MLTAPYVHLNSKKQHGELGRASTDDLSSNHGGMSVVHSNSDSVVSMVDYTNLYIKNLDPEVTSYDLFKSFKDYGRIISARVMRDTMTSISKGYGFVSFSTMEEANEAQQHMNGALINSKHIVVTFHTHKKPANSTKVKNANHHQRLPQQQHVVDYMNLSPPTTASSSNNNTVSMYPIYNSQPSPPYSHHRQNGTMFPPHESYIPAKSNIPPPTNSMATAMTPHHHYAQNPWNETGFWMHPNASNNTSSVKELSPFHYHHLPSMHAPNISQVQTQTTSASALVSPSTDCASPPLIDLGHPYYSDNASTLPSQIQIQKIRDAVSAQLKEDQQKDLNDLVDLIQSLKKRDLSLCLFNPMFLKQKIEEAYEALYLFQNPPQSATPVTSNKMASLLDESNSKMNLSAEQVQAASFILSSLEGMTLNKKKRVFGDIFFPFVRATGVKHAPKVTIRLLDTVPLEELAYNMYDKPELTRKAQYIYNELYSK